MRLSLRTTMMVALVFAVMCAIFAIRSFAVLGDLSDPTQIADAKGYAWFWTFLASVAIALGVAAWWIARRVEEGEDS